MGLINSYPKNNRQPKNINRYLTVLRKASLEHRESTQTLMHPWPRQSGDTTSAVAGTVLF